MKTAFLFSGQGAQYVGMGKELYENFDCARDVFDEADAALGFSIKDICFNNETELNRTENTQPAILTIDLIVRLSVPERGMVKGTFMLFRADRIFPLQHDDQS